VSLNRFRSQRCKNVRTNLNIGLVLVSLATVPAIVPAVRAQDASPVPIEPRKCGEISFVWSGEFSGIVKSRKFPDTYWVHEDSGAAARIYPIRRDGTPISPPGKAEPGVRITGASNVDWEDIAFNGRGDLIIGDIGNNRNLRRDLTLYFVREPDPETDRQVPAYREVRFRYPDQRAFPPVERNFDAEALFWSGGAVHLLTKHRSDTDTKLYRFETYGPDISSELRLMERFGIKGGVAAADSMGNGRRLVVLTNHDVWLFLRDRPEQALVESDIFRLPINIKRCEGICFDGAHLLLINEPGEIFELPLSSLPPYALP